MSDRINKLLGAEVNLTTAVTLGGAQLVRILGGASDIVVTVKEGATTTGSITVKAGTTEYIRKKAAETIEAASAVKAVSVAFGD
jgi:hypothetical protein